MSTTPAARSVLLHDVAHGYDDTLVLRDIDLEVAPGEAVALLGPSGCGKTTLLRIIAGLERPRAGSIQLGERVVADADTWVAPERRQVGMVFQDWALFPHLSVADNVGYGLPRSERSGSAVEEALSMVGLAGYGDRMPATLSGGQQQRVALARALAPQPGVLLLDEPFSNLDTSLRVEIRTEIHRLLLEVGITSIFVTHDQEEAFVIGDRVAVMQHGHIAQLATPHDLYVAPASREVAEFVGSASLITGTANNGTAETTLGPFPVDASLHGPVEVMVRPEQCRLVHNSDTNTGPAGVVELVEFYGHDAMVFARFGERSLKVRVANPVEVRRGDDVRLVFADTIAHAFAASTDMSTP